MSKTTLSTHQISNGVPSGGTAGQVIAKIDGNDYNTQWVNVAGGLATQLEQARAYGNPIQPIQRSGYYALVDPYTQEYAYYKQITSSWTASKCDGFMYIAAGSNYYERVISTPYINAKWFGAIADGNSHPLSTINDPSTGVPFASLAAAQVYYPTATSLTNQVDGLAIQNAVNFAIYSHKFDCPKVVWLSFGKYLTSDTIHLGYGDTFTSVTLKGTDSLPYDVNNWNMKGAAIYGTFSDRMMINIQGQRDAWVQGIDVVGVNTTNPQYNEYYWSDPTQYVNPGLSGSSSDSQTAPYAGIVIDGYGGPRPSSYGNGSSWVDYPDVNYPIAGNALGINISTQYNKNCTSRVAINNCSITNFIVGAVLQPSGIEANGDFVKFNGCVINTCKYGVSSGAGQARLTQLYQCQVDTCWVCVTNAVHGQARGRVNLLMECHFSGYQVIYFSNTAWNGPLAIKDCYGESLFQIGYFGNTNTDSSSIMMENCDWNMDHTRGVPLYWFGIGSKNLLTIKNTRYAGAYCPILANNIEIDGCTAQIDYSLSVPLGGNNLSTYTPSLQFTGGFPVVSEGLGQIPNKSMKNGIVSAHNVGGGWDAIAIGNDKGYDNRSECLIVPAFTKGYFLTTGFSRNEFLQYTNAVNGTFPTLIPGQRLLTMPISNVFSPSFDRFNYPGDILVDYGYGHHWLLLSKDSSNYYFLLMNGFTYDTTNTNTVGSYAQPLILGTHSVFRNGGYHNFLHTNFNRSYSSGAGQYTSLIGDVIAGSPTVSNIRSADGQTQNPANLPALYETISLVTPNAGIALYYYGITSPTQSSVTSPTASTIWDPNSQVTSYQGPYYPTAFDTTNNTITLDIKSAYTGKVYLFNTSIYK